MTNWLPTIVSHRGLCDGLPFAENSREAFIAATAAGFPVECDVWPSADGEPVVIHDPTLNRTTFGTGPISNYSSDTLRKVRLRTSDGAAATVPMLRDVASQVNYVEIKPNDDPSLVAKVMVIMAGKSWKLMSFDPANLMHAARLDASVPAVLLIEDLQNLDAAIRHKWTTYADHSLLSASVARRLRDAGMSIGTWGVDSQEDLRRILPMQPEVIISNAPRLIQRLLRNKEPV
jgi:glycerophosphoryl diester phosphodiesterase